MERTPSKRALLCFSFRIDQGCLVNNWPTLLINFWAEQFSSSVSTMQINNLLRKDIVSNGNHIFEWKIILSNEQQIINFLGKGPNYSERKQDSYQLYNIYTYISIYICVHTYTHRTTFPQGPRLWGLATRRCCY